MLDASDQLGRADAEVWTAIGDFTFDALKGRSTGRTGCRHLPRDLAAVAPCHNRANNIGNNIPGALDRDNVADANVTLGNIVSVMQTGVADGDTAEDKWFDFGIRSNDTGAPDIDADRKQPAGGLTRREFVGNRPARVAPDHAQCVLLCKAIDF